MGAKTQVMEFLDKSGVAYEVTEHPPAFTAQTLAAAEHEPGRSVAKPVIVRADDKYVMCVLSACDRVDLSALKSQLGVKKVELAEEKDVGKICSGCELGAEAPFGNLYDMKVIVEKELSTEEMIAFCSGTHTELIQLSYKDFEKLVKPKVLAFSLKP